MRGTGKNSKMAYGDVRRLRPGKHNMEKGAMRPEDAAVCSNNGKVEAVGDVFVYLRQYACGPNWTATFEKGGRNWAVVLTNSRSFISRAGWQGAVLREREFEIMLSV